MEHSRVTRAIGFVTGWFLVFCLLDWFLNFVLITVQAVNENVYLFYFLFMMLLVMVVGLRVSLHPPEGLEVSEVKDFLRESLFFNNYVRRKDAEFREEYNRFIMQKIHRETSDKPMDDVLFQTPGVMENRFENNSTESTDKEEREVHTEKVSLAADGLKKGETIDASDVFRVQLMNNEKHRYLSNLNEFIIDPAGKIFTIRLSLPDTLQIDEKNERQMNGLIGELYEMLQLLQSRQWLQPYTQYFRTIRLKVSHSKWGELGSVSTNELLTISFSLANLRRYDGMNMPGDSIKKIAAIEYHIR
jgi:hypothetical protein